MTYTHRFTPIALGIIILIDAAAVVVAQRAPVENVVFYSESVERLMKYNIILPADYGDEANRDREYPTLYLLHGAGSNFEGWRRFLGVTTYALGYAMILVMPDAGNSFYVNWAQTDDDRVNAWEDYIIEDVVGHVETTYRARSQREARAITGFSMGGYGALTLGLRRPDLFISIGSQSGALEYARRAAERLRLGGVAYPPPRYTPEARSQRLLENPEIGIPGFSSIVDRTPSGQPFVTSEQADAHDPFMLVMRVSRDELPFIQIDCGTSDQLCGASQAFAKLLLDADIPFDYTQLRGGHDPGYWIQAYGYAIGLHHETMQRALGKRPIATRRQP